MADITDIDNELEIALSEVKVRTGSKHYELVRFESGKDRG